MSGVEHGATRGWIITAFATVYVVWGSTYLAIRFALESFPPLLMASARFLIAGSLLFCIMQIRKPTATTPRQWLSTAIAGALMLAGGNGLVCWAEQTVPSGLAALLIGSTPLWMVLTDWALFGGTRPTARTFSGILVGLCGVALLVGPVSGSSFGFGESSVDPKGAIGLLCACLMWSLGSLIFRKSPQPKSPFLSVSMQMLCGGAVLLMIGSGAGEWSRVSLERVSAGSVLALAYLIVFGAIIALTAYVWLLRVCSAAHVATYAYVNPVVALLLGWLLAEEKIGLRTAFGSLLIIGAVMLVTLRPAVKDLRPAVEEPPLAKAAPCRPSVETSCVTEEPVA